MQFLSHLLLMFLLLTSRNGFAQVWETLAQGTQLFTQSCPAIVGECRDCGVRTSPAHSLLHSSEVISDNAYLAALAEERALNHACGIAQLEKALGPESAFYNKDIQDKVELLSQAILKHVRTSSANSRIPARDLAQKRDQIAKVYQEETAAIAAIQASIPFSSHPVMARFISKSVQEALKDSTTIGALARPTAVPPRSLGSGFAAQIQKTLGEVGQSLKADAAKLNRGVQTLGASLDRGTRESLAQDRDLIESYFQRHPRLRDSSKGPACRVDRTYGKGAEDRDQALFAGSIGLGALSGGLALSARGAAFVSATNSVRLASARGLLTANSARVLGSLAVHTGRSALALGTVGGLKESADACLNQHQVVPRALSANSPRCESYSVKGIKADSCYLAAGLTALGSVASVPAVQRWAGRILGRVSAPANRAEEVLGQSLTLEQQAAVQRAHEVGIGSPGRNGRPAGIGNYTDAQLREKAEILRTAGFGEAERRKLMEAGVVGLRLDQLPPGINSPYVSYVNSNGERWAVKIIGADDGGYIVESADGLRQRISAAQISSVRESSSARLAFERLESSPPTNAFRDNFLSGSFAGDSRFISVQTSNGRLPARIVELDDAASSVKVEILDPRTGQIEVRVLTKDELLSARESSTAIESFRTVQATPTANESAATRLVQRSFQNQPGQAVSDEHVANLVSRRSFEYQGSSVPFNTSTPSVARETAIREGRLLEIRASEPRRLSEGAYTYVITRDGTLTVGRVEDSFEYGVKHSSLARGREVVSAGELRVKPDGSYDFNHESGTFVRPLIEERGADPKKLSENTRRTLEQFLRARGTPTEQILLPRNPPNRQRLNQLCTEPAFCAPNARSCRQVFGPEVCR